MLNNLSKKSMERLNKFPGLKSVVEKFIASDGLHIYPGVLCDLTVYIRILGLDEPFFFGWNKYDTEEFYSWGHNSRYSNVLEPMLCCNLNRHICKLLNYLEETGIEEPDMEKA